MLNKQQKIAIYMEGSLGSDYGKMGYGVMRYIANPIVCVIDSTHAGKKAKDVCSVPADIPVVADIKDAYQLGAEVLILGTAPSGGRVPDSWYPPLEQALSFGMSLINGLHDPLSETLADKLSGDNSHWIWDTRKPAFTPDIATAQAANLSNKRVLFVGTDMAIGKMTAGLEIYDYVRKQNQSAAFIATGQIGITVTGEGIPLDAFKVDHACGAVETAVMNAAEYEYIFVEGQGSLLHPGSSATLSLMRGSCANRLIMCHRGDMQTLRKPGHIKIPPMSEFIALNENLASVCGSLTTPKTVGIALNSVMLDDDQTAREIARLEDETGLPVEDVVRNGAGKLGEALISS
ncbi:MAG: putative NAD-dependent epimerase/dehydratase family protein [Saprospiraceae bacterium]|jgi:uncharacterized NAD-dependent epimerase/dehydratase family protein